MDFSAFPTSLRELRDKARVWAQENGLAGYAGYMGTRGKGDDEDQESALSWQREAFSSRIDMVGLNLNLPVRPVLLSGDAMEDAKEVLREAYRNEPLFRWLLGDVRKDNKGKAKENLLLEWLVDWRISSCARFSHTLAIPRPPRQGQGATFGESGEQEVDVRGCAVVTYPGRYRPRPMRRVCNCSLVRVRHAQGRARWLCAASARSFPAPVNKVHAVSTAMGVHPLSHSPSRPLLHSLPLPPLSLARARARALSMRS